MGIAQDVPLTLPLMLNRFSVPRTPHEGRYTYERRQTSTGEPKGEQAIPASVPTPSGAFRRHPSRRRALHDR